MLVVIIRH